LKATPPTASDLANALAVWLPDVRVVAYNGDLLNHALNVHDLDQTSVQRAIDNIAWHEYGHALSATRASPATKRDGPRLLALLPPGLRAAIDYPGGYRQMQVFDEVIANVYALVIGRASSQVTTVCLASSTPTCATLLKLSSHGPRTPDDRAA
jgi:phage tail protein X